MEEGGRFLDSAESAERDPDLMRQVIERTLAAANQQRVSPGMRVAFKGIYSDITERSVIFKQYNSIDGGPSQLFGTPLFRKKANQPRLSFLHITVGAPVPEAPA